MILSVTAGALIVYQHGLHKLFGSTAYARCGKSRELVDEITQMNFPSPLSLAAVVVSVQCVDLLDRKTALYLWTRGSAWFSGEHRLKGGLSVGAYADVAVRSDDYFAVEAEKIKEIESVMTVMNGRIVYANEEFSTQNPPLQRPMPDWSPVRSYGGYCRSKDYIQQTAQACSAACTRSCNIHGHHHQVVWNEPLPIPNGPIQAFWGALGCSCFAI
jgi:hypothetical protein